MAGDVQTSIEISGKVDTSWWLEHAIDPNHWVFWIIISLAAALVINQGLKAVVKQCFRKTYLRKAGVVFLAFLVCLALLYYNLMDFFEDRKLIKYAINIAILNNLVFLGLTILAERMKWVRFLGWLKVRKVSEVDGELKMHDTVRIDRTKKRP